MHLTLMIGLFSFALFFSHNAQAQTYGETVTFMKDGNTYSFDYTLVCGAGGTTAALTVNFTAPPPGIVPQIHLGGGMFVGMTGPNPYTYQFTGLTGCNFSFQFWMAYAGGLYASSFMTPANTPLPILLTNFSAAKQSARTAILNWKTSTEISSDYFGIERSNDGQHWESIDKVQAAGDSYTDLSYSYLDTDLPKTSSATIYYRLKMADIDGTYEYSNIRSVQFGKTDTDIASIYPNPASSSVSINSTQQGMLTIKNFYGRSLKSLSLSEGENVIPLDDIPNGMYILQFANGQVKSLIKQ